MRERHAWVGNRFCIRRNNGFGDLVKSTPKLGLVNLVIGPNNAGKTRFFDALRRFASSGSAEDIAFSINLDNFKIWMPTLERHDYDSISYIRHQFRGSELLIYGNTRSPISPDKFSSPFQLPSGTPDHMKRWPIAPASLSSMVVSIEAERRKPRPQEIPIQETTPSSDGGELVAALNYLMMRGGERLVKRQLKDAINSIMKDDPKCTDIRCQLLDQSNQAQIFFDFDDTQSIAIDRLGSGMRTVCLVCLVMLLRNNNASEQQTCYLFEELENNIHPRLQRSLYSWIQSQLNPQRDCLFLSTHSPVALDHFIQSDGCALMRVSTTNGEIELTEIESLQGGRECLRQIGSRPSDILQANGIVWVEGPSDRIYLLRLLECWGCEFKENLHFSVAFTSGTILKHYSASDFDPKRIHILRINPNAFLICDRDRTSEEVPLKTEVLRMRSEVGHDNCLITAGYAIENYLPPEIVMKVNSKARKKSITRFAEPAKLIGSRSKADFAETVTKLPDFTRDNLRDRFGLDEAVRNIISAIERWNR